MVGVVHPLEAKVDSRRGHICRHRLRPARARKRIALDVLRRMKAIEGCDFATECLASEDLEVRDAANRRSRYSIESRHGGDRGAAGYQDGHYTQDKIGYAQCVGAS